ncbi:MAG: redoxin domain-containing protein [Acidimicrobiales bacterium]|jgi:peroxiredoxin
MSTQPSATTPPASALQRGDEAPEFALPATPDQIVRLSEIRGPVVLIFYPADWSPVCGDELSMFEAATGLFAEHGAQLIGISVDSSWCHLAYKADRKLSFPLLADFHPKGAVAKSYGVFREADDTTERAIFVLDAQHSIAWSYVSPVGISPGVDGALRAVEALS